MGRALGCAPSEIDALHGSQKGIVRDRDQRNRRAAISFAGFLKRFSPQASEHEIRNCGRQPPTAWKKPCCTARSTSSSATPCRARHGLQQVASFDLKDMQLRVRKDSPTRQEAGWWRVSTDLGRPESSSCRAPTPSCGHGRETRFSPKSRLKPASTLTTDSFEFMTIPGGERNLAIGLSIAARAGAPIRCGPEIKYVPNSGSCGQVGPPQPLLHLRRRHAVDGGCRSVCRSCGPPSTNGAMRDRRGGSRCALIFATHALVLLNLRASLRSDIFDCAIFLACTDIMHWDGDHEHSAMAGEGR